MELTLRTSDDGATLVGPLLDLAVLTNWFGERTDLEEAHEHRVVTSTIKARLVSDDTIAFAVMLEHVVTPWNGDEKKDLNS